MKQNITNSFYKNIDNSPTAKKKILSLDPSYKWRKYWKFIDIYFYFSICISFVLFLIEIIIFLLQKNLNLIKTCGLVFGFASLGFLVISWILVIFFKGPIKFINYSQRQLENLHKKQNKIIFIYRIIFFSLTIIPTFMMILSSNIVDRYYIGCSITIYLSFALFIILTISAIILYVTYLKNKRTIHKCVIEGTI